MFSEFSLVQCCWALCELESKRPVLGWQERWPSVAPCCCSQWLDHLIMMFVLMSSCTDVPEKNYLVSVFILPALYLFDKCFVAEWRWYRETTQFLRRSTVWNQTIYYCWGLLYAVGLESSRGETEKSNADKKYWKETMLWAYLCDIWAQYLTLLHANESGMMNLCWISPWLFKSGCQ